MTELSLCKPYLGSCENTAQPAVCSSRSKVSWPFSPVAATTSTVPVPATKILLQSANERVTSSTAIPTSYPRSVRFISLSRVRLLMFATRADVVRLIGPFKLPALSGAEHTPLSSVFDSDSDTFEIVASASELVLPEVSFYHLPHKPHQCGSYESKPVWSVTGLSPCILTAKSPLFLHGHDIVTPSLLGFARIQGFELEDLPADPLLARRAIGNGCAIMSRIYDWLCLKVRLCRFRPTRVPYGRRCSQYRVANIHPPHTRRHQSSASQFLPFLLMRRLLFLLRYLQFLGIVGTSTCKSPRSRWPPSPKLLYLVLTFTLLKSLPVPSWTLRPSSPKF
jgi:hypothetical protein